MAPLSRSRDYAVVTRVVMDDGLLLWLRYKLLCCLLRKMQVKSSQDEMKVRVTILYLCIYTYVVGDENVMYIVDWASVEKESVQHTM